jgi:hypothetical protein
VEPPSTVVQAPAPAHTANLVQSLMSQLSTHTATHTMIPALVPITDDLLEDMGHPKRKRLWTGNAEALVANSRGWGDVNHLHPKKKA